MLGKFDVLHVRFKCVLTSIQHVYMIQPATESLLLDEDLDEMKELIDEGIHRDHPNKRMLAQLNGFLQTRRKKERALDGEVRIDLETGNTLDSNEADLRALCAACNAVPVDPCKPSCCDAIYCRDCIVRLALRSFMISPEASKCLACERIFYGIVDCPMTVNKHTKKQDSVWYSVNGNWDRGLPKKNETRWIDMQQEMMWSTRLRGVRDQIRNWLEEAPNEKIIVFTQFHDM